MSAALSKELKTDRRLGRSQTCDGVREKFAQRIREGFKAHGGATPASVELLNRALRSAMERAHQGLGGGRGGAGHADADEDEDEDYDADNLEDDDDDGDSGGRLGSRGLAQMDGADLLCLPQMDGVVGDAP